MESNFMSNSVASESCRAPSPSSDDGPALTLFPKPFSRHRNPQ